MQLYTFSILIILLKKKEKIILIILHYYQHYVEREREIENDLYIYVCNTVQERAFI